MSEVSHHWYHTLAPCGCGFIGYNKDLYVKKKKKELVLLSEGGRIVPPHISSCPEGGCAQGWVVSL